MGKIFRINRIRINRMMSARRGLLEKTQD